MPVSSSSATATKARKGRRRATFVLSEGCPKTGSDSLFCRKERGQARAVEAHPQRALLGGDHLAFRGALRLPHVLAPRPGDLGRILATRAREVGGEQRRVTQRARVRSVAGAGDDDV